jgi:anti-sigma B factor antagonist
MAAPSPSIDIETRQSGSATIVDVNGDITLRSAPQVRRILLDLFREKRAARVLVNLGNVRYIDSAGIASLVEALRLSRDMNRGFALFALNRVARQVLELTRLTRVFEIHDDEQSALAVPDASQS